jgi:hypothetical protein
LSEVLTGFIDFISRFRFLILPISFLAFRLVEFVSSLRYSRKSGAMLRGKIWIFKKAPITQIPRLFSRSDHLARKDPVGIKREEFEAKRLLIVGGAAPNTYR